MMTKTPLPPPSLPPRTDQLGPGEEKKARRTALPLSEKAAEVIRSAGPYCGLSQDEIKSAIATRTLRTGAHTLDGFVALICLDLAEEADKRRKESRETLFPVPRPVPAVTEEEA
jgi:hypothetical protein